MFTKNLLKLSLIVTLFSVCGVMPEIVVYQTESVWFVKNEYFMAKIDVCRSLLPSDRVIGWDIKMMSHPNSNASFINIWDRLNWRRSPNLTKSSKLAAAPNWSGSARKSELLGPENWVSGWRTNLDIYSQNDHGLVYDMILQFLGMEAKNYKFGMFCQQCHPSVAPGRNVYWEG